jgi:hypothetical protein
MKQSKLSILENKYYYGASRYFWHIIIALSLFSIIGGVAVYLWSVIPPSKDEVTKGVAPQKQKYPEMKKVSLQDIINSLPKKKSDIKETSIENEQIEDPEEYLDTEVYNKVDTVALSRFNKQIKQTKKLIPDTVFSTFWQDQYKYYFDSKRNEKMFKKTHNPLLRKRKIFKKGFKLRFVEITDRNGLTDYNDKADLLESTNLLMQYLDMSNRISFINNVSYYIPIKQMGSNAINQKFEAIGSVLSKISPDLQLKIYNILWNFIRKNPNDGVNLVKYEADIIGNFALQNRLQFIKKIQKQYKYKYNNKLDALIEATNQFLPYVKQIENDKQSLALEIFYRLYYENNKERSKEIQTIENQYKMELASWEAQYQAALTKANIKYQLEKSKKSTFREMSYESMAGGFAAVLLISLILLILSMIRNVNRLAEAMFENTKVFQNQITKIIKEQETEKDE